MPVAEQESTIDEVAHAGELVRSDDRRDAMFRRFTHDARDDGRAAVSRHVVDEHDVVRARRRLLHARPMRSSEQEGRPYGARWSRRPDAGGRRDSGATWSCPHRERREWRCTHRRAPRASRRAAPRCVPSIPRRRRRSSSTGSGREGRAARSNDALVRGLERHRCSGTAERSARRLLASGVPRSIIRDPQLIDVTSGGCRAGGRSSTGRPHDHAGTAS